MKVEIRQFKPEVREDGGVRKITGRPIVFNSLSEDLGGFREKIAPGAIEFSDDLRADFAHDSKYILGTHSKGTLEVAIDAEGVSMAALPPDTQWARDLMESIVRGDIEQGSFAFDVLPGGQTWTREGKQSIRTLTKILVSRLTVTSNPAYTDTSIQVRSAAEVAAEIPVMESAGQAAPPAQSGGVSLDLLRRMQDQIDRENQ